MCPPSFVLDKGICDLVEVLNHRKNFDCGTTKYKSFIKFT